MERETLVSIHNSGESFEKCVSLIYNAVKSNPEFYNNYDIVLFYGHNLNKKVENYEEAAHGSVKFYQEYFSNEKWLPECSSNYLWSVKSDILFKLMEKRIISSRFAEKMESNYDLFSSFICRLPFEYIYPEFIGKIVESSESLLPNVKFVPIDLEHNYKTVYENLPRDKQIYSIYSLENNLVIGHYDMAIPYDYRHGKRLDHLYKELGRRSVLSGNSAMFLASIDSLCSHDNILIGYRNHKYIRPNRDMALNEILKRKIGIIEPKNINFNAYYDIIQLSDNMENQANRVVALAYKDYITENIKTLKLR